MTLLKWGVFFYCNKLQMKKYIQEILELLGEVALWFQMRSPVFKFGVVIITLIVLALLFAPK